MRASKLIRWLSLLLVFNACVLASEVTTATSDYGALTKGGTYCGTSGYWNGGMGSYSPAGLTGGTTVTSVYDYFDSLNCTNVAIAFAVISVAGFSSNPGSNWLNSVTCNGVTMTGTNATFYYNNGSAAWQWSGSLFGLLSLSDGANVSCAMDHN